MAKFRDFGREIQVATAGLSEATIRGMLANFARQELAGVISRGEGSAMYDRYVNGRKGLDEDDVIVPGPILYDFIWWAPIIEFALKTLHDRSPVLSGDYRNAWHVRVNNQVVTAYDKLPRDAEIYITNDVPYARKIEVGHMRMSVPPGVVEQAKRIVSRKYGRLIHVSQTWMRLPNPYILKGHFTRGIKPGARRGLARDTRAGAEMTYPALYMDIGME